MGFSDKIENAKDDLVGKGKEALGDAKDDASLEAEGKAEETEADLKQAGEKIKDAFNK